MEVPYLEEFLAIESSYKPNPRLKFEIAKRQAARLLREKKRKFHEVVFGATSNKVITVHVT